MINAEKIPELVTELEDIVRNISSLETRRAAIKGQIVAVTAPKPRTTRDITKPLSKLDLDAIDVVRKAGGPISRADIAERMGVEPTAVDVHLRRAVEYGVVFRPRHGYYECVAVARLPSDDSKKTE